MTNVAVMTRGERIAAWVLFSFGLEAIGYFLAWWLAPGQIASRPLFVLFTFAVWFSAARMVANWFALLHMTRPRHRPPPAGLKVDVMTTAAPGEPLEMLRAVLCAMVRIRYPHTTYLLDDSGRDELQRLCAKLGVRYIRRERPGEGAKAGNVNHALDLTSGEFVTILDPDHLPGRDFLDRVLGHFDDPSVGFVQAPQAYRNQQESVIARGGAEQTYELYGPTLMGLHTLGSPLVFGCHTTFRRSALASIGGYAVHNAEDLRTTMRLYAKGWKGVYVPEILARGLTPADLATFLRQQYRWAHSVFDLLFRDFWRLAPRWTFYQRVTFFFGGTYYLVGVVILINLFLPLALLATGWTAPVRLAESFIVHVAPLVAVNFLIRRFAQRFFLSPDERGWHLAGTVMQFAACFAHVAGLIAAMAGTRVPYIVTAKGSPRRGGLGPVRLQGAVAAASGALALHSWWVAQPDALVLRACALWNAAMMGIVVWIALNEEEGSWDEAGTQRPEEPAVRGLAGPVLAGHRADR
jgi:cellulose synthase (UDP-forming)